MAALSSLRRWLGTWLYSLNKLMLQYELLTVKNMNYCNYLFTPSLFVISSEVCALLDSIINF